MPSPRPESAGSPRATARCSKCRFVLSEPDSIASGLCRACSHEQAERLRYGNAPRSRPEYAAYRFQIIAAILDTAMTPRAVSELLAANTKDFPEITSAELRHLYLMGDVWTPPGTDEAWRERVRREQTTPRLTQTATPPTREAQLEAFRSAYFPETLRRADF